MPERENNRSRLKAILASPYFMAGASILPAVMLYLFSRRIRPVGSPTAEATAKRIREGGIGLTIDQEGGRMNPIAALLRYGTPHVGPEKQIPKAVKTVVEPFPPGAAGPKPRTIGSRPLYADSVAKVDEITRLRNTIGPHAAPHTVMAAKYLDDAAVAQLRPDEQLKILQTKLQTHHPAGYVIKSNFSMGGQPLHEGYDLAAEFNKLYKWGFNQPRPEWDGIAKQLGVKKLSIADAITYMKKDADIAGELIKAAPKEMKTPLTAWSIVSNPFSMIIQDRVPMIAEYRMHVHNGRILRRATIPRHDRIAGARALAGIKTKAEQQLEDRVEKELLSRMPTEDVSDRFMALDVAVKPDGTPVMLELNPTGWSGFIAGGGPRAIPATATAHRWISDLAGQETVPLAGAKALGAGALGAGVVTGARALSEPPSQDA